MNTNNDLQIQICDINADRRPKLAKQISEFGGDVFLLSSERLSDDPEDNRLVIYIVKFDMCGIIEDIPSKPDKSVEEQYHLTMLNDTSINSLRTIISKPHKTRKESTGRPPKYSMEIDGAEIFIQHVYEGQSIKDIAKLRHMSPTTAQKLLNQSRIFVAENFLNGTWQMSRNSANWDKDLSLIKWVIKHTTGAKQQEYKNFLASLHNK